MSICFDMNPFTLNANPKKKKKPCHVHFCICWSCQTLPLSKCKDYTYYHLAKKKKKNGNRGYFSFWIYVGNIAQVSQKNISTSLCSSLQGHIFVPWLTMLYLGLMPNKWQYLIIRILRSTHT